MITNSHDVPIGYGVTRRGCSRLVLENCDEPDLDGREVAFIENASLSEEHMAMAGFKPREDKITRCNCCT